MTKKTSQKRVAKKKTEQPTLMQRFGLFFYDRRELTILYMLALLVFGVLSYTVFMQRQGFPGVDVPVSTVAGTYFVNDREKVDADITRPASMAIASLPEVETVTTQAGDNFFLIVAQYKEGTNSQEGNALVRRELTDKGLLPQEANAEFKPINGTKFVNEYDLLIAVYRDESASVEDLTSDAKSATAELQKSEGIERATVLEQLRSGVDPRTGRAATERQYFDRIGVREGNETKFYPSATIGIVSDVNGDALKLSDDVRQVLERLQSDSSGLRFVVSADFAEDIRSQISGLQESLLQGLAAVVLVCFLLISWRASLTAATSMLTVILITLGILYVSGNTLNTITLFALILSLGLIVDDTIIMVEAIDAAKNESRRKRDIVKTAIKRVLLASTAGTLTTILAFAPMLFIGGILGDFIRVMPVTVIIALTVSLLVSIALVPLLASGIILRKAPKPSRNPVLRVESWISGGLSKALLVMKRSRARGSLLAFSALGFAAILIVAGAVIFQGLKFDIFPSTKDSNAIELSLTFAPGIDIVDAQKITDEVNRRASDALGENVERFAYWNTGTDSRAAIRVDLTHFDDRDVTSPQLVAELEREFEGFQAARVQVRQIDVGPPEDEFPFRMQVYSEDEAKAKRLAEDIARFLQEKEIERKSGTTARVVRAEIINLAQLSRIDGKKAVQLGAAFDADDTSALVTATQDAIEKEFPGERVASYGLGEDALQFDFGTETENQESFRALLVAFPVLLVVMYLLLALQFKSFLQPLLIFMAIPFSFFGVALGLHLSDNSMSFFVMIGFFALVGIAVNNAILLTDYANQAKADGRSRIDAIAYAIKARFRPLITTSLTSVVALTPLALSDPFWESLSITLIFGLLSSTLLVVLAFPYVYLAGEAMRIFGHRLWARDLPKAIRYPFSFIVAPLRLIAYLFQVIFRKK